MVYKPGFLEALKTPEPCLFDHNGVLSMEYSATVAEGRLVGHEFWEFELQRDTTLITGTDCVLGWLSRSDYQQLMHHFVRTETEKRLPGMLLQVFKEQVNLAAARRLTQVLVKNEAYWQSGRRVFEAGEVSDRVYLISKGTVKLLVGTPVREIRSDFDRDSKGMLANSLRGKRDAPNVLVEVGAGEFFGADDALKQSRRSHSAVCATDCCLMFVTTSHLLELMAGSPSLQQFMTRQSVQKRQNNEECLKRVERVNVDRLPILLSPLVQQSSPTGEDERIVLQTLSKAESREHKIPRKDFVPLSKKRIAQFLSKPQAFWDRLDDEHSIAKREHLKFMDRWIYRKQELKLEERRQKAKSAREKQSRYLFANYLDSQDSSSLQQSSRLPLDSSRPPTRLEVAVRAGLKKSSIDKTLLSKLLHRTKALDGVMDTHVSTCIEHSLSQYAAPEDCSAFSSLILDSRMCKSMDQNRSHLETEVSDKDKSSQRGGRYDSKEKHRSILASLQTRERAKLELLTKKLQPVSLRRDFIRPSPSKLASNSVFE